MNKLALITGASSGIGFELAKIMAHNGHDLIITARSKDKLNALAKDLIEKHKVKVIVQPWDLSQKFSGEGLFESLRPYNDNVEFIVNNAGFAELGEFHSQNLNMLNEQLQLNIVSLTELCRLYSALFVNKKLGSILNVASTAAYQAGPYLAAYYAAKSYVLSLSQALRYELQPYNVKVSALCPGPTESGFQLRSKMDPERFERLSKKFGPAIMTSEQVASIAYKEWMKNKDVIIPGLLNKIGAKVAQVTPHPLTSKIVASINQKK